MNEHDQQQRPTGFTLVTDTTCGHVVVCAAWPEMANEQAHLADLAGHPTTQLELPPAEAAALDERPDPAKCPACLHRLQQTTLLMQRERITVAAVAWRVDPWAALRAFTALRRVNRKLTVAQAADYVIARLKSPRAASWTWDTDALIDWCLADPGEPS